MSPYSLGLGDGKLFWQGGHPTWQVQPFDLAALKVEAMFCVEITEIRNLQHLKYAIGCYECYDLRKDKPANDNKYHSVTNPWSLGAAVEEIRSHAANTRIILWRWDFQTVLDGAKSDLNKLETWTIWSQVQVMQCITSFPEFKHSQEIQFFLTKWRQVWTRQLSWLLLCGSKIHVLHVHLTLLSWWNKGTTCRMIYLTMLYSLQ